MHIVGYVRVSTDRQADEGLGLLVQESAIRLWCKERQFHLLTPVDIYRDEGLSGALDHDARPGLAAALATIEAGEADALIVYKLDRLARSLTVQEAALAHVWRNGGEVYAVDQGQVPRDDVADPMRTALRQMIGVFSQLERGMIAARMQAGRRLKHAQGGYAYGAPPYGWRARNRELIPIASEQQSIALARKLRNEGVSLRTIAQTLENLGHERRNGSTRWHPSQVARAISSSSSSGPVGDAEITPIASE